jgi:hypothetical protein
MDPGGGKPAPGRQAGYADGVFVARRKRKRSIPDAAAEMCGAFSLA